MRQARLGQETGFPANLYEARKSANPVPTKRQFGIKLRSTGVILIGAFARVPHSG
jgi:hypothetical protein